MRPVATHASPVVTHASPAPLGAPLGAPLLSLLLSLAAAGCPGASNGPASDTVSGTIEVKGRVVDFESCITGSGCLGVPDVKVGLFSEPSIFSAKTAPSGTFAITNAPVGSPTYLYVYDVGGSGTYLSSLQVEPVALQGSGVYGLELFALKRQGALFSGIIKEAKVNVQTHPLYIGQVFKVEQGSMKALPDVSIQSTPAAEIRYVNCISTFSQCAGQPTLFASRSSTGQFGQFVVISKSASGTTHTITATGTGYSFKSAKAPLGLGYVTIGVHRASGSGASDAAVPKEGGP